MKPRWCVSGLGFFEKKRDILSRPRCAGLIQAGHRCGWGLWQIKINSNVNVTPRHWMTSLRLLKPRLRGNDEQR